MQLFTTSEPPSTTMLRPDKPRLFRVKKPSAATVIAASLPV